MAGENIDELDLQVILGDRLPPANDSGEEFSRAEIAEMISVQRRSLNRAMEKVDPDKYLIHKLFLDLYEMAAADYEPTYYQFRAFCQRIGFNIEQHLGNDFQNQEQEPQLIGRSKNLLQVTLIILAHRLNLNPNDFPGLEKGIFVVGGHVYREAERLADLVHQRMAA